MHTDNVPRDDDGKEDDSKAGADYDFDDDDDDELDASGDHDDDDPPYSNTLFAGGPHTATGRVVASFSLAPRR